MSKAISQLTDPKKSYSCPSDVRLGARVLVRGRYAGSIRYVGDLDSNFVNSKIYIGVKLDDPGKCIKKLYLCIIIIFVEMIIKFSYL